MTLRTVPAVWLATSAAIALSAVAASDADACTVIGSPPFVVDESADVGDPPGAPIIGTPIIGTPIVERARGFASRGCAAATSCDDITFVSVPITPPDGIESEDVGYVLAMIDGARPEGFVVPEHPISANAGGLQLSFAENLSRKGPLDVRLSVRAIDRGGNLGPPVTVRIVDRDPSSGCSAGYRASSARAPALLFPSLLLLALRRRSRARRDGPGGRPIERCGATR